jgi:hypothetical protein
LTFKSYYGVDFSGAKEAGRNTWVAHAQRNGDGRLELVELSSLEKLCGCAARDEALRHLVKTIASSKGALWSLDMPFGLPIELFDAGMTWPRQLEHVRDFAGDAYDLGLWCCEQGKRLGGPMHIRRTTDVDTKTPFDCYHYRIVYQTYHGMRDVLAPLSRSPGTAVLPFQYPRLKSAKRVVLETCPASTLKRWGAPHQNYKQPAGGPLTPIRLRTRRTIVAALAKHIDIPDPHRRVMMRNDGGDAIDAVIALVGGHEAFHAADHAAIRRHPRYRLEGHLFA